MCSVFAEQWVVNVNIEPLKHPNKLTPVGKYFKYSFFKGEHYVEHVPPLVLIKNCSLKTFPPESFGMTFPAFRHVYVFYQLDGILQVKCKDSVLYLIMDSIINRNINNKALCYLWIWQDIFVPW